MLVRGWVPHGEIFLQRDALGYTHIERREEKKM